MKIVGVAIGIVSGLFSVGEKLYTWGKSARRSLKKIHSGTREKFARANQAKKAFDVELKDMLLKKA